MSRFIIQNVVLMIAVLALFAAISNSESLNPNKQRMGSKWRVHIVNKMDTGGVLFVHCKSKDDDLGKHNVTRDREFTWGFKENFWETTLFWCYFRSSHGHARFEVFWPESQSNWLEFRCDYRDCIWTTKDDGIYLLNIPFDADDYKHEWETYVKG